MGLKGQLEDLPLIDMLQITAFSQKSGYLRVSGPEGRGAVVLKGGRVLFAFSWSTMGRIREMARKPEEITVKAQRENIESAVRELAGLREGSFEFELTEEVSEELGGVDIAAFVVPGGLDAQELLLDLAVEIDSERREATSLLELAFEGNLPADDVADDDESESEYDVDVADENAAGMRKLSRLPPPAAAEIESGVAAAVEAIGTVPPPDVPESALGHTVVLVDDELPVTSVVGKELRGKGYQVFTGSSPSSGLDVVRARAQRGEPVLVVTDLKMPTSSGRSFYGGFELIRRLKREHLHLPVLLMVESLPERARERAKVLGIRRIVYKPTLTKPDPELYRTDLRDFAETVHGQLERLVSDRCDQLDPRENHGNGDAHVQGAANAVGRPDFLAAMTRKLVGPGGSRDVSRLVLQVASRFLERGVLFVVKSESARGLAGFGFGANARKCALLTGKMVLDIGKSGALTDVVTKGKTARLDPAEAVLATSLLEGLGPGRASEAVLVPMLYNRVTLLLLYGDNGVSDQPLGDLGGLELFMAQAGMALENKLLQQKLTAGESFGPVGLSL